MARQLSISSIYWEPEQDSIVGKILQKRSLRYIDIAPTKYFGADLCCTSQQLRTLKAFWASFGIQIYGMQSICYGKHELNMFDADGGANRLLLHIKKVCQVASSLGVSVVTFGSPRNREKGFLDEKQHRSMAIEFFQAVGNIASLYDIDFCIEPLIGTSDINNFTYSCGNTLSIVKQVGHPNIKLQLDTGILIERNEDPSSLLPSFRKHIGHIHISNPFLKGFKSHEKMHLSVSRVLDDAKWSKPCTIEILRADQSECFSDLQTLLSKAKDLYLPR